MRRAIAALFTACLVIACAWPARAQSAAPDWIDAILDAQLKRLDISGATVAWVQDGAPNHIRGYGLAERETNREVTARTTFRIGSLTKLFVWTAIWQLVERGEIDLDDDVNQHLEGFRVADAFGEPVRVRHLMDHTAGFETRHRGTFARNGQELDPLRSLVTKGLPPRIRPPGRVEAYSNWGTCLAAYLVESVAQMPFEQFVRTHTLDPLGMADTSLDQPLPAQRANDVAHAYRVVAGSHQRQPFELIRLAPAGSMSASAQDMAKFILAMLDGKDGWLKASTIETMQAASHHPHPQSGAMAHGWFVWNQAGLRVLWHGGDTNQFHSLLMLVPERRAGLFVSYAGPGGSEAYRELMAAVLEHLGGPADTESSTSWALPSHAFGAYRSSRAVVSSYEALDSLMQDFTIEQEGGAVIAGGHSWKPVAPWVLHRIDGKDRLVFETDLSERVLRVRMASKPMQTFERLAWKETAVANQVALVLLGLMLLVTVGAVRRGVPARPLFAVAGVLGIGLIASVAWLVRAGSDVMQYGRPAMVSIAQGLWVAAAGTFFLAFIVALSKRRSFDTGWQRVIVLTGATALSALILWGWQWRLVP